MEIGPLSGTTGSESVRSREGGAASGTPVAAEVTGRDLVEISLEGRRHLADLANAAKESLPGDPARAIETESRLQRVKDRIASGFYESREVTDALAERLSEAIFGVRGEVYGQERYGDGNA